MKTNRHVPFIIGVVLLSFFTLVNVQASSETRQAISIDGFSIPYPSEDLREIFLGNQNNPRFKQINFDGSLKLFFVTENHSEPFLWENNFIPQAGFKVNIKPIQSDEDGFKAFVEDLSGSFYQTVPRNTVISDTLLGRVCAVKNMFPIKIISTSHSVACLWLFEYEIPDEGKKDIVSKNYYLGSYTIFVKGKMLTLSIFMDLSTEMQSETILAFLTSWGSDVLKNSK